jgi:phosphatidylserine/phosphatidylglycerophosphate/cardiolipin synthase-like enzyme
LASSTEKDSSPAKATRDLGLYLTGTEAGDLADRLDDGDGLTAAMQALPQARRARVRELVVATRLDLLVVAAVLRGVQGARLAPTTLEPLWTMPGHLAQTGRLTSSVPQLVLGARVSVVCSTFNFQRTSGLWAALCEVAQQPDVNVRVYVDTAAAVSKGYSKTPTTAQVADHLRPAVVLRTRSLKDRPVRNHAKFLAIDHRFLLVTSANFSLSAERDNVEFGVLIDDDNLTESVEREMRQAESTIYERVGSRLGM